MQAFSALDERTRLLLRQEVGRFRARESRRVFDLSVHVGRLGDERYGYVVRARDLPAFDDALRAEVVSALVESTPTTWRTAWLTRPGTTQPHDLDGRWLSAFRGGFEVHARQLEGCFVLTRAGWRDLLGGETREWARLRL